MAHDGTEGISPEGWLPDRVSVGALTRTFPPELVDRVVATTDTRELRRRNALQANRVNWLENSCDPGGSSVARPLRWVRIYAPCPWREMMSVEHLAVLRAHV